MKQKEEIELGAFAKDTAKDIWIQAVEEEQGGSCEGCYYFYNALDNDTCCQSPFHCIPSHLIFEKVGADPDPYQSLNQVLADAESQASQGKGKARHATDNAFEDQLICQLQRILQDHPFGGQAFQAIKKTVEAGRLFQQGEPTMAYNEILGAINYLGAMGYIAKTTKP